ncbi:MAG: ATP-binding protein [Anaerolineae bacterium]|jgi:signal transduction histidine kinase/FixJ family two-component response regulator|nr:ATP-binding protein [Anaerolineae bacterium]
MTDIKVLVIDDDRSYQILITHMLSRGDVNYIVEYVPTYETGLEAINRGEHQIYLIDYDLGQISGIQLMREAMTKGLKAPVIMMTGQVREGVDMEAIKAGATDYIDKADLKPTTLQRAIHYALERDRVAKERERHAQQFKILHQVDDELSQVLSMNYVQAMALDLAVRLSGADTGYIGLFEGEQIRIAQAIGGYSDLKSGSLHSITPLIKKIQEDLKPRLIRDVNAEPEKVVVHPKTVAQMLLPLISSDRIIGILNIETNKPERFTDDTFEFLKLVTGRVAVALDNARLYQVAQERYEEMQRLYTQVSGLEQLKTDMIRVAAHDLRNPASVIIGYVELVRRVLGKDGDKRAYNYLDMIDKATRRIEKITNDILSLERIENSSVEKAKVFDLNKAIQEAFYEHNDQATEKEQDIDLMLSDMALMVRADDIQIVEAAANLLTNAIKYTPSKGKISVLTRQENGHAIFEVKDTGFGIPEEMQGKLFQPFFRAKTKETDDIEGTGLGLYLIKNIIERFGGKIVFSSVYLQGSTFGFRLPMSVS